MVKVCAVIVLYNNVDEFSTCLQSLEEQSRSVDHYILIDNSTDKIFEINKEVILNKKIPFEKYTYIKCKENRGSSFGFALGMYIAFRKAYDLIWLNDQDGVANNDCLKNIIKLYDMSESNVGIYVPNVCDIKTLKALSGFHIHSNKFLHGGVANDKRINSFGTAGVCITHDTIKRIGFYNYKVCYVGNEDKEYALRARKNKIKIRYVSDATYYHPDAFIKYQMRRKKKKYYWGECVIPLNMGVIKKEQETDLRCRKLCESSSYINYKYADYFHRNINFIYSIIRVLLCKCCNFKETINAYRKGRQLAFEINEKIYENDILDECRSIGIELWKQN